MANACFSSHNAPGNNCKDPTRGSFQIPTGATFEDIGPNIQNFKVTYFKFAARQAYDVHYDNLPATDGPLWNCTCPDFRYRRAMNSTMCKHCQGSALLIRAPTPFVTAHVSPITQQLYGILHQMPIGSPLAVFGPDTKIRVNLAGESGYIAFTRGQWKCYTCGGRDGRTYLKGRQCKHIACYSESLVDDDYEQYYTVLANQAFSRDMRRQRRQGRTAWQRFN